MLLACQCCGRECIEYGGYGRPKKYCKRCKPWAYAEIKRKSKINYYKKNKKKVLKLQRKRNERYRKSKVPNKRDGKKVREYRQRWAVNNWREMNINGWTIFVRCDAYHVWWRWKQRQSKEYQKNYQEKHRQKPKVKQKQKDYHKNHREKYHRGTDMGSKPRRYASGDINLKNERSVIDAEFRRLGLKKERKQSRSV